MPRSLLRLATIAATVAVTSLSAVTAGAADTTLDLPPSTPRRHALEVSPVSPLFHIYAVQYGHALDDRNELLAGFSYADIPARRGTGSGGWLMDLVITPNTRTQDVGVNHSWTLFVGYRRHLWRGLHAEYQLWPAYNAFWSDRERRTYAGFDLWNEFRLGYTIDLDAVGWPCYLNLQYLVGFGLYEGNKPAGFGSDGEQVFRAPVLFVGSRF
jgi:hypothetical protein